MRLGDRGLVDRDLVLGPFHRTSPTSYDVELSGRTQLVTVERVKLENAWRTFAILAKVARSI